MIIELDHVGQKKKNDIFVLTVCFGSWFLCHIGIGADGRPVTFAIGSLYQFLFLYPFLNCQCQVMVLSIPAVTMTVTSGDNASNDAARKSMARLHAKEKIPFGASKSDRRQQQKT